MNRTQTAAILQARWRLTGQPGGNDPERIAAWHTVLERYDYRPIHDRLNALVDRGERPELPDLVAGIRPNDWQDHQPEPPVPTGNAAHARAIWRAAYEASGHHAASIDRLLERDPGDAA